MAEWFTTLKIEVAAPDGLALSTTAVWVQIQTVDGIIQVFPNHAPVIAGLAPGELIVAEEDGTTREFVTGGGFVRIEQNQVTLLSDLAKPEDAIEEEVVRAAMERAEEAMAECAPDDTEELAMLELQMLEARVQLELLDRLGRRRPR